MEVDNGSLHNPNDGDLYLLVHSGSRNLGLKIATYFQRLAVEWVKAHKVTCPKDLEYLPMGEGGNDYLYWMRKAQDYAHNNRLVMLRIILHSLGLDYDPKQLVESVHNYISPKDNIVRKGAISAYAERVVIPLNMADGTIIGIGKANEQFNNSAPHGAGRLYGRKDMLRRLDAGQWTLEEYQASMDGIFTTSVSRGTFDESKFAYKDLSQIEAELEQTVNIAARLKPVYNLKASEASGRSNP
jgi:tRNA-splicing ligase RtcB